MAEMKNSRNEITEGMDCSRAIPSVIFFTGSMKQINSFSDETTAAAHRNKN